MLYQENNSKTLTDRFLNIIVYFVFVVYILLLIKAILFKDVSVAQIFTWDVAGYRAVNIIPFKTIYGFLEVFNSGMSGIRVFANIFGNIGIFMPLGYLLPLIFPKLRNLKMILLISIGISIILEIMQYVFSLGSLDIDDVFLNTIGTIAGLGFFCLFKNLFSRKRSFYIATIVLIITSASIMSFIIWEGFSDLIGVNRYQTEEIGSENIPTKIADYEGTYIEQNKNYLKIYTSIVAEDSPMKDLFDTVDIEINNKTELYYYEFKEISKWKSQIIYKVISLDDLKDIETYSQIDVWLVDKTGQKANTIVFSENIGNSDEISISNQEINIEGKVESVSGDLIEINLETSGYLEDGSQFSIIDNSSAKRIIKVQLNDEVTYLYKLLSRNETLKERAGQKKDIKKGVDLEIIGKIESDFVIAESIIIYDFNY